MKTRLGVIVAPLCLSACANHSLVADPEMKVPIKHVLTAIRCEFVDYVRGQKARFDPKKPWVIQGKLIVSAETATSAGAGAKLTPFTGAQSGFFSLSGGIASKSTSTSTIDFDLDPGTKLNGTCPTADPGFGLASWLEAVENAKASKEGLTLRDKSYVFGLAFGVSKNVNAAAGFAVQPLGLTAEAARKRDDVQTLSIAIKPRPEREVSYIQIVQPKAQPSARSPQFEPQGILPPTPPVQSGIRYRRVLRPVDLSPELERKQKELLGSP